MTAETLPRAVPAPMTHKQILQALSGLYLGIFVAILSSTVVTNALPTIVADLHAGQSVYTWVITAALLSTTVSSPVWGKLADLVSKKLLVQASLTIFTVGSVLSGLSADAGLLIAARVVQGIGAGGLMALIQVIIATMIPPRELGRYSGYFGAVFAVGTSAGPLIGGLIVDTDWLGWRWCFFVGVPFAVVALIMLQKTLNLPVVKGSVKVDWAGSALLTAAASVLLIWVTLAGDRYAWLSWPTAVLLGGTLLLALAFVAVERRAAAPVLPLWLFRTRTVLLAITAGLAIGVALYSATTYLSQYFQLAEGKSPTVAGLLALPQILSLALASSVAGRIITATGRWKPILVTGAVLITAGLALLGFTDRETPYWQLAVAMTLLGLGLGSTLQNLVLAVQNQVSPRELGAATSSVSFFRTLGGTIGVSALGAVLAGQVGHHIAEKLGSAAGGALSRPAELPAPVRAVVEEAYGQATGTLFQYAVPLALVALVCVLFIREVPLRTTNAEGSR
ncbi:MDR family MFS transporter [Amycolatopsis jiangsuensis]|uniref:EmrB/QacA subfamily drug resistance transporter n=1 Tax=Amycolatopsis jiangsuensis TaxID=1181879 RepID=A0A840IPF5_9PSEU|nr:MDR family MFS transporter [Amycolatopsis jiangsuensis]MBB4684371.1 EmrB/QacA subfamily drug resistance transporter [Amycolatopsis jiangsuensis]